MTSAHAQALKDAVRSSASSCGRRSGYGLPIATPIACMDGEGTIARIDAGEGMRNLTEARAHELETIDHQ
jgi:hypothetical protein